MDCQRASELLVDYLYQELEPDQVGPVEAHLASCPRCASRLESLKAARVAVQQLPQVEPREAITRGLLEAAAEAVKDRRQPLLARVREALRIVVMHPAMTAAATLIVVVGISFYAYQRSEVPGTSELGPLPEVRHLPVGTETTIQPQLEQQKREGALSGLNEDEESTASIASRDERPAKPPPNAVAVRYKGADRTDKLARTQVPLARQTAEARNAEKQAPMDNRRHVGTRGLWNTKGRLAQPARKERPRPRRRRKALGGLSDDLDGALLSAKRPAPQAEPMPSPSVRSGRAAGPEAPAGGTAAKKVSKKDRAAARSYLKLAEAATQKERCEAALRHYSRALALDPALASAVRSGVRRCVVALGQEGEQSLAKAGKRYPALAGYFKAEIRRKRRARAKAASRARKAKQAAPAQADAY